MEGEGSEIEIGARIREARMMRGWTHEELARRMGVNWRSVQRWQKGRLPRVETLRRLAEVLEVPPSYFLGESAPASLSELRERLAELAVRVERLASVVSALAEERADPPNGGPANTPEKGANPSVEGG